MKNNTLPQNLQTIAKELKETAWINCLLFKSNVYIVGGSIRDALLNKKMKDIDLIVEGLSLCHVKDMLSSFGKVDIVGESFSVVKFKPDGFVGEPFDIAIPRMDRKTGEGHKEFEIITENVDILTDLKRRDFTVNSIALNIQTLELVDPFNGLEDLSNNVLRATDDKAFIEDALRIVRGIQFASRFGFVIEEHTFNLMKDNVHLVKHISGERIFEEFQKIINKNGNTSIAFQLICNLNLDQILFNSKIDANMSQYLNTIKYNYLDQISFFFLLAKLGKTDPGIFIKYQLKGDSHLEKNLIVLDKMLKDIEFELGTEDFKFILFKSFEKAPDLMNISILSEDVLAIIEQMKVKTIPTVKNDIKINGDDILSMSSLNGKEIGMLMNRIIRDALMNKFKWNDRIDSLNYLKTILL